MSFKFLAASEDGLFQLLGSAMQNLVWFIEQMHETASFPLP